MGSCIEGRHASGQRTVWPPALCSWLKTRHSITRIFFRTLDNESEGQHFLAYAKAGIRVGQLLVSVHAAFVEAKFLLLFLSIVVLFLDVLKWAGHPLTTQLADGQERNQPTKPHGTAAGWLPKGGQQSVGRENRSLDGDGKRKTGRMSALHHR